MALSDQETICIYKHLNKVFKEDLHISRPLVQMLRQQGLEHEASECSFLTARRMLSSDQPSSALGFLEICRQIGHPDKEEIDSLMIIAELTGKDSQAVMSRLFPLIDPLSDYESLEFLRQGRLLQLEAGVDVLVQDEISNSFYLILDGTIHIHMQSSDDQLSLTRLQAGDFFGEFASIYRLPRSATASTETPSLLLELSEGDIGQLIDSSPLAGEYLIDIVKRRMIHSMSRSHPALMHIDAIDRDWLAEKSSVLEFSKGSTIDKTSIPENHCAVLFIGSLEVTNPQDGHPNTLKSHDMFGCKAMPVNSDHDMQLRVLERCFVYCIPIDIFLSFRNAYADFDRWITAYCDVEN